MLADKLTPALVQYSFSCQVKYLKQMTCSPYVTQSETVKGLSKHCLMPVSHERILRRIIRRFGSFPTRTYSNRISNDAHVRIAYEERSGRVFNLNKTCA